jgi:Secretion system C-terminal sorting domain
MRGLLSGFGVLVLLIMLATCAMATNDLSSAAQTRAPATKVAGLDAPIGNSQVVPGPYTFLGLDEEVQMGDTVVVSVNWRDQQHNCNYNRMMAYDPDLDGDEPTAYFVWMQHDTDAPTRHVAFKRVHFDEDGNPVVDTEKVVGIIGAGYVAMDIAETFDASGSARMAPYITQHQRDGGDSDIYKSWFFDEASFLEGLFLEHAVPNIEAGIEQIWPQLIVARNMNAGVENGQLSIHGISNGYEAPADESVYYWKYDLDETTGQFTNVTPGAEGSVVEFSTASQTLSTILASNETGDRVVIANTTSRWALRGKLPASWDGLAMSQSDNDIYYWLSEDGGSTWDWDNPVNVTNFVEPDESFLPGDTTAANQDSLRAYAEVDAIFSDDDVLHLVFNVHQFDYLRESVYRSARVFYWNSANGTMHQIADADFWNYAAPVSWERLACHQQLYFDPETDILWCMYQQYGEAGDTIEVDDTVYGLDASSIAQANSDLYMSASPDNGRHWAKGVNITRTRTMEHLLEPGECRSERDPSFSLNNEGEFLNIFYGLDFDAGISGITGGTAEGIVTENQMVYQRVSKAALIDSFNVNAEWVPNYSLHYDAETQYYDDGNDWAYTTFDEFGTSVQDNGVLTPNEFELQQNYPNPFNPSTQIAFNLKKAGVIQLAVYDVLGREVAQLVNRSMNAGDHKITFIADELPSGVYFYKLTSGSASQVKKMVLMK